MDVSKNRGIFPPKCMVKIMVPNPMNKWMIWGYQSHRQMIKKFKVSGILVSPLLSDDGYNLWGLQNELA